MRRDFKGKKILIMGGGTSGTSAAIFLNDIGALVEVRDEFQISQEHKQKLARNNIAFYENSSFDNLNEYEYIIKSPGIPWSDRLKEIQAKNSDKIMDEIELASRFINVPVISVTGTNGKSTVVSLISHVLKLAGFTAFTGGNIGIPLTEAVNKPIDVVVLELSSYQIETLNGFRSNISVILNITPDHLNRYKDFDDYAKTKFKLIEHTADDGVVCCNYDDEYLKANCNNFKNKNISGFSVSSELENGIFVKEGIIYGEILGEEVFFDISDVNVTTFMENILASYLVLKIFGIEDEVIVSGMESFKPLSHRLESFHKYGDVIFIDDSKSTNPDSLSKAVTLFPPEETVLLIGGEAKSEGYDTLRDKIKDFNLVFFGKNGKDLQSILKVNGDYFSSLDDVTKNLKNILKEKENIKYVVLSPGCASFDEFKNFNERGDYFKKKVRELFND